MSEEEITIPKTITAAEMLSAEDKALVDVQAGLEAAAKGDTAAADKVDIEKFATALMESIGAKKPYRSLKLAQSQANLMESIINTKSLLGKHAEGEPEDVAKLLSTKLKDVDIVKEYDLIQQKVSKLSYNERNLIVQLHGIYTARVLAKMLRMEDSENEVGEIPPKTVVTSIAEEALPIT